MAVGIAGASAQSALDTWLNSTWVQLHTSAGDPGAAGTSNVSAGSTTRLQPTWNAATTAGVKTQSANTGPWTNSGTSETIAYISLWTASTAGTFKGSSALTTSKAWASGDTLTLTTLSYSFTPIAA